MTKSAIKQKDEKVLSEMVKDGLGVGSVVQIRGLERNLHTDDMTGGKFMSRDENFEDKGDIMDLVGHVAKIDKDSIHLVFGWNANKRKPEGLGGVQVYGSAIELYRIYESDHIFYSP